MTMGFQRLSEAQRTLISIENSSFKSASIAADTATDLIAANLSRKGITIVNNSPVHRLYVALGTKEDNAASPTNYYRVLPPDSQYPLEFCIKGAMNGIFSAGGSGDVHIIEEL